MTIQTPDTRGPWDQREAEAVALLPGWVNSRGALLERRIATALGLLVGAVADFLGGEPS